jgi:hypothetical protein
MLMTFKLADKKTFLHLTPYTIKKHYIPSNCNVIRVLSSIINLLLICGLLRHISITAFNTLVR